MYQTVPVAALVAVLSGLGCMPGAAKSLLPGVIYEIDPALPSSTSPLGQQPGIQVDVLGGVVAMRLAGSNAVLHAGYGQSMLVQNGIDGQPIIANPPGGQPGGWESLVLDPVLADPIAAKPRQPFTVELVARRRAVTSCDIMKLHAKTGTQLLFSTRADGTILIGQNDGRGTAAESVSSPLDQWNILYYVYDGRRGWMLRDGQATVLTPDYTSGGFGQRGAGEFQLLNGCGMDVAWLSISAQAPSIDQINAESARLRATFPSIAPQHPVLVGDLREMGALASNGERSDKFPARSEVDIERRARSVVSQLPPRR